MNQGPVPKPGEWFLIGRARERIYRCFRVIDNRCQRDRQLMVSSGEVIVEDCPERTYAWKWNHGDAINLQTKCAKAALRKARQMKGEA